MSSMKSYDFSETFEQYVIKGRIILEGPLRIGRSINEAVEYSTSAAPVLLDFDEKTQEYYPFIPGSSLKGLIRSTFERIAKTYGLDVCQIIDSRNKRETKTCGRCLGCDFFGSENVRSRLSVRDAHVDEKEKQAIYISERPHYNSERRVGFYQEEIVHPISFNFHIDIHTSLKKEEYALLLLTLNEFNLKRVYIGGGVSRGHGSAKLEFTLYKRKILINEQGQVNYQMSELQANITSSLNFLSKKYQKNNQNSEIDDFRVYYQANNKSLNGCIAVEFIVKTITKFKLKGIEEETVTLNFQPVIPGSVVKGYLKNKFKKEKKSFEWINNIFGSIKEPSGRSRIIITDAIPKNQIKTQEYIPENTELTMVILFDNMKERDLKEVLEKLKGNITITGGSAARGYIPRGPLKYNKVQFEVNKAWKFTTDDVQLDLTDEIEDLMF
ncbi:MAG: RAMP superfamily CRISPR-associated protein [Candidatus Heimdallarchaeaceae archaeon]